MLADVHGHKLAMLGVGMGQDVLDQVVAILVAGNVNEWDPGTVRTALAHTVKVSTKEFSTTNLETLLNNLRGELIHAILRRIADHMVNSTAAVGRSTMFTDVLNAPVAELTMGNYVDVGENLFDAGTLNHC